MRLLLCRYPKVGAILTLKIGKMHTEYCKSDLKILAP